MPDGSWRTDAYDRQDITGYALDHTSKPVTMFCLNDSMLYWLWSEATDMRKSFHTLSGIVRDGMKRDPLNGDVYVFINRSRDRIKLLHWERGGLVLYSKILDRGTFGKPSELNQDGSVSWSELVMMVEGIVSQGLTRLQRLDQLREKSNRK